MSLRKVTIILLVFACIQVRETCRAFANDRCKTNQDGECIANCEPRCGHGTCVDANKCVCRNGYELREGASPQCVPKCRSCNGECVAPDTCRCREPYRTVYMTANNTICSCRDECESKCSKVICVVPYSENTTLPYFREIYKYTVSDKFSTPKEEPRGDKVVPKPTNQGSSTSLFLCISVGANIIFLAIIVTLVYKTRKIYCRRSNVKITSRDCNDHNYVNMGDYRLSQMAKDDADNEQNEYDYARTH